jgi:hypothetical protein
MKKAVYSLLHYQKRLNRSIVRAMNKQTILTIKKNILLDWIYKQKNNVPVNDLMEFIKSHSKTSKISQMIIKSKNNIF